MHVNIFWMQVQDSLLGECFVLILVCLMAFYFGDSPDLTGLSKVAVRNTRRVCAKFAVTVALISDVFDVDF
jgi:hypothetical protein